jgi:hypothetical protein
MDVFSTELGIRLSFVKTLEFWVPLQPWHEQSREVRMEKQCYIKLSGSRDQTTPSYFVT